MDDNGNESTHNRYLIRDRGNKSGLGLEAPCFESAVERSRCCRCNAVSSLSFMDPGYERETYIHMSLNVRAAKFYGRSNVSRRATSNANDDRDVFLAGLTGHRQTARGPDETRRRRAGAAEAIILHGTICSLHWIMASWRQLLTRLYASALLGASRAACTRAG